MQFYVLRFLLGVAEAGFFPAIIYYLSQWYPASMRARSSAWFMIAIPLSGAIGGPLGGWLLGLNGVGDSPAGSGSFCSREFRRSCSASSCSRTSPSGRRTRTGCRAEQRDWLAARLARDREESPAQHGITAASRARASDDLACRAARVSCDDDRLRISVLGSDDHARRDAPTNMQTGLLFGGDRCVRPARCSSSARARTATRSGSFTPPRVRSSLRSAARARRSSRIPSRASRASRWRTLR